MVVRLVGVGRLVVVVGVVVVDFSIGPPHLGYSNYNNSVPVVLVVSIPMAW